MLALLGKLKSRLSVFRPLELGTGPGGRVGQPDKLRLAVWGLRLKKGADPSMNVRKQSRNEGPK